jgi:hypothetical protein
MNQADMSVTLQNSRVVILVKAMPNPSQKYGETVCCAGVTAEGNWKRLYPIRFRHLRDNKFKRWDWVRFEYRTPTNDHRSESCHVWEDRLSVEGELSQKEHVSLLDPLILPSITVAAERGMSLTLVRPLKSEFCYGRKSAEEIGKEREGYRQMRRSKRASRSEKRMGEKIPPTAAFEALRGIHRPR